MKILAIETSCDETALALIESTGPQEAPSFTVLNTALNSQIDIHKEYGGVFPAMAKRAHAANIIPLLDSCLKEEVAQSPEEKEIDWQAIENILEREPDLFEALKTYVSTHSKPDIDMLAVTYGPGLEPALWVGINTARALSKAWNIPLMPTNHMKGHIASVLLEQNVTTFPTLAVLISGGHTELVHINDWDSYKKVGQTLDDAIGEAYDKVARMIDLPYPGGPEISKLAQSFRVSGAKYDEAITLPRPMLHSKDLDFSFSGLKTAVLYLTNDLKEKDELTDTTKEMIAYEFEEAVTEVLSKKVQKAINEFGIQTVVVGGGVIANQYIREKLLEIASNEGVQIYFPQKELSTDNAVMIAMAAYIDSFTSTAEISPAISAKGNLSF